MVGTYRYKTYRFLNFKKKFQDDPQPRATEPTTDQSGAQLNKLLVDAQLSSLSKQTHLRFPPANRKLNKLTDPKPNGLLEHQT